MKSDIEIARSIELKKIKQVAESVDIPRDEVENYGRYIAKIPTHLIDEEKVKKSNLILVTAITATKAGIGKTTVSIGLALGLNKIGKKAIVALREPSLGPCFGMKGGAAGGGYAVSSQRAPAGHCIEPSGRAFPYEHRAGAGGSPGHGRKSFGLEGDDPGIRRRA